MTMNSPLNKIVKNLKTTTAIALVSATALMGISTFTEASARYDASSPLLGEDGEHKGETYSGAGASRPAPAASAAALTDADHSGDDEADLYSQENGSKYFKTVVTFIALNTPEKRTALQSKLGARFSRFESGILLQIEDHQALLRAYLVNMRERAESAELANTTDTRRIAELEDALEGARAVQVFAQPLNADLEAARSAETIPTGYAGKTLILSNLGTAALGVVGIFITYFLTSK